MSSLIYASYDGSQVGFTVRNTKLEQLLYTNTKIDYSGVAAGVSDDLYLTAQNHIYHYSNDGDLIKDMDFPDGGVNYVGIAVKNSKVYAAYKGSQRGVSIRDLELNQDSYFKTDIDATGIAVDPDGHIYLTAQNHIYKYHSNGSLIKDMAFSDTGVIYTDISIDSNMVCASYDGSQKGFTVRDLQLNQEYYIKMDYKISSIHLEARDSVYIASDNNLYHYKLDGTLIKKMQFSDSGVNYTSISAN